MQLMSKNDDILLKEQFKDWIPEIIEYDMSIDGGDEHLTRDELLAQKDRTKDEVLRLKQKRRINKVRR